MSAEQETQSPLGFFKLKVDQNNTMIFVVLATLLLLLEAIISIINKASSLNLQRLSFYMLVLPLFMYTFVKYVNKRGVDASNINIVGVKFSMEQERFTSLVSLSTLVVLVLSTFLYIDSFIFQILVLDSSIDIQLIPFQTLFVIYFILTGVIIKVFGTDEDTETKYYLKKTQYLVYAIMALALLIPAFLVKDNMYLHQGNFTGDNENLLIFMNLKSELNFSQHLLLQTLGVIMLIFTSKNEITKFLNENNKNKVAFVLVAVSYFIYDMIALTTGANSPSNMMKQIEIIVFQASTLILISAGLTLTTRVRKFGNFAHSEFITVGLFTAILIRNYSWMTDLVEFALFGIPIFGGNNIFGWMLFVFLFTGLVGILAEILVFTPLERRKAARITLGISSIGLGLVIRQTIQELFGGQNQSAINPVYPAFFKDMGFVLELIYAVELFTLAGIGVSVWYNRTRAVTRMEKIGSAIFAPVAGFGIGHYLGLLFNGFDRTTIVVGVVKLFGIKYEIFTPTEVIVSIDHAWAVVVMIITVITLRFIFIYTTLGISMRATADDPSLAQISGINTRRVIFWTWFIAAGITGIGALWRFEAANIVPFSGFTLLLIIFAVVILGGFDSFEGTLISAFIVASVQAFTSIINQEVSVWQTKNSEIDTLIFWNPNADWTQVIPFAIIIFVLFVRPRGIFGVVDPRAKL